MALSDNPAAWILRLFEMEVREGRGRDCICFLDGTRPSGFPLDDGELVYGVYKEKYYFTPTSLFVSNKGKVERIPWADVRSCSSRHGEGKTFSDLILADGRTVRVRVADMATGWSGRISQLFHQMIECYGQRAAISSPLMSVQDFFAKANDDYSIAPNLDPHPSLDSLRTALLSIEKSDDGTRVYMDICDDDNEALVANAIVVVTPRPREDFQDFANLFGADGIVAADEQTIRRMDQIPNGFQVWHVLWD